MVERKQRFLARLSLLLLGGLAIGAAPAMAAPRETKETKPIKWPPAEITRSAKLVPLPRPRPMTESAARRGLVAVALPTPRPLSLSTERPYGSGTGAAVLPPRRPSSKLAVPDVSSLPAISVPATRAVSLPASDDPPLAYAPTAATSRSDIATVKKAIRSAQRGRSSEATALKRKISDPFARKLVEWAILRSSNNGASFARYNAFIAANPTWPSVGMLRRRAEAMLWAERADYGTIRAFFAKSPPRSAKGRFALARALLARGDRAGAQAQVRRAWTLSFSKRMESEARERFGRLITRADDKARMDRRLYERDFNAAMRAARRLGGSQRAIARAHNAVRAKSRNAKKLLDAVPASARNDVGYQFSRIRWLRRNDRELEAAKLLLAAPSELGPGHDRDDWWIDRRVMARTLIELKQPKAAYLVVRNAAQPTRHNYKVQHEFLAGWIALRFLNDPATAARHFARIHTVGAGNTTALARAGYWQGRAAEAAGRQEEARGFYRQAAHHTTTYYGQLAGARLGLREIALKPPPAMSAQQREELGRLEVVRAVELLYAIDQRRLVVTFVAGLANRTNNAGALTLIGDLTRKHRHARASLYVGKLAVARGLPLDHHAFPTFGLPSYKPIGPEVEPALVYSIARQESAFNPRVVSSAKAMGLMQVTPAAGRFIARTYGVRYSRRRLLNDSVYNMQMGAAELGGNIEAYRGSYILAFAGYNAGRGRVKQWIRRFGDPRDPRVDPVDWVERIPFAETRNYVQRILENIQAYRIRFGQGTRLLIETDIHRGSRRVSSRVN